MKTIKKVTVLSKRELEVARLIATDAKPIEMSDKLGISIKTISTYRARILQKLKMRGLKVRGNVGIAMVLNTLEEESAT